MFEFSVFMPALLGAALGGALALAAARSYWRRRFDGLRAEHQTSQAALAERHAQQLAAAQAVHAEEVVAAQRESVKSHQLDSQAALERLQLQHVETLQAAEARRSTLEAQCDQQLAALQASHTAALAGALSQSDRQHELDLRAERQQLQERHERALQAVQQRFDKQLKKIESPLTVLVHPFVNTSVDKGLIRNSSVIEVGYKYQLLVQGIPCFPPHDVVVERQSKVEVDEQALAHWGAKALEFAQAASQIKGGGIASTLISVAKTVVQNRK